MWPILLLYWSHSIEGHSTFCGLPEIFVVKDCSDMGFARWYLMGLSMAIKINLWNQSKFQRVSCKPAPCRSSGVSSTRCCPETRQRGHLTKPAFIVAVMVLRVKSGLKTQLSSDGGSFGASTVRTIQTGHCTQTCSIMHTECVWNAHHTMEQTTTNRLLA